MNGTQLGGGGNNFQSTQQCVINIVTDNESGTATENDVALIRGTGDGSSDALPTGVTISGDYDNYNELQAAFRDTGIMVRQIILESTTTTHFTGTKKITRYERLFNNKRGPEEVIYLNTYKTDSGGGVSTTCIIPDKPFFVTPRTVMIFEALKNSVLTVTFIYDFEEKVKPIAKAS